MYRRTPPEIEAFLGHMGGPYFRRKDAGAWTIPKGEPEPGEDPLQCALREFEEETGMRPDASVYLPLGSVVQAGGKKVTAWAFESDWGARTLESQTFELEWPPRSGKRQRFPELDRVAFFALPEARQKIIPGQRPLLDRLARMLAVPDDAL